MKVSSYLSLLFMVAGCAWTSCTSETFENCDPIGTWRLEGQTINGCSLDLLDEMIEITDAFCTNLPQGEICRVSEWRFLEENVLEIDLILIFAFDDDDETIIETLRWSYVLSDDGRLEICPGIGSTCGNAVCDIVENQLLISLDIRDCRVEFDLLRIE